MPSACTARAAAASPSARASTHRIDIIEGTLAKAFGTLGGYIAGIARGRRRGALLCAGLHLHHGAAAGDRRRGDRLDPPSQDARRPSATRSSARRRATKDVLAAAGLPVMPTDTHIVPVLVGDPELCKMASDRLLGVHGIYIQPINYPTVPRGTERLRITPTPLHTDGLIDALQRRAGRDLGRARHPLSRGRPAGRRQVRPDHPLAGAQVGRLRRPGTAA